MKTFIPQPTLYQAMAGYAYEAARFEGMLGVEPLNSERVLKRLAADFEFIVKREALAITQANGVDKLQAVNARLKATNATLADQLATSVFESNKWHRELQKCREADNRARNRGERTDLLEKELAETKEALAKAVESEKLLRLSEKQVDRGKDTLIEVRATVVKLNDKLNDARHIADSLREENRRMAAELEGLRRFRRKNVDEMAVRVEHPDMLPVTAKAE